MGLMSFCSERNWFYGKLFLVFLVLFIFGLYFLDTGYYDGDGNNILAGSLYLPYVELDDVDFIYNYAIQPLVYELNAFVYVLFGNASVLYYLPLLFGALALTILVYLFSKLFGKLYVFMGAALLFLFPELLMCLLYENSTVFAMLPYSILLLLAFFRPKFLLKDIIYYPIIGVLVSLIVLFRFDFVIGVPVVIAIILHNQCWNLRSFVYGFLGLGIPLIIASFMGVFNPAGVMHVISAHHAFTSGYGLSLGISSLLSLFHFSGFILLCIALFHITKKYFSPLHWGMKAFFIFTILVLLYPLINLVTFTSPTYLIPFVMLSIICIGVFISSVNQTQKTVFYSIIVAFALLSQFIVLEPVISDHPHLSLSFIPKTTLSTHDGVRYFGAYFWQYHHLDLAKESNRNIRSVTSAFLDFLFAHNLTEFNELYYDPWISFSKTYIPLELTSRGYDILLANQTTTLFSFENQIVIIDALSDKDNSSSFPENGNFNLPTFTPNDFEGIYLTPSVYGQFFSE